MLNIEDTEFGKVTVNGQTYDHDIVVLSNNIIKRKKWITKEKHGTSHKFTRDEMGEYMETVTSQKIDRVVIGTGQYGKLSLLPETEEYLEEKDIEYELKKTSDLVDEEIDEERSLVIIHVTC
ncbi:MAG: MTH938/NDUFAF3 family protein [Candidatus Natronoplasma sp.]